MEDAQRGGFTFDNIKLTICLQFSEGGGGDFSVDLDVFYNLTVCM